METIFSKIINGEIPAAIVYEDDTVVAFLDHDPVHPGHTLIVPRKPFVNIFDGDDETLAHMMVIAKKVATALVSVVNAEGINLHMNNNGAAGQEVFHAHLHVVPRYQDDNSYQKPHRSSYDDTGIDITALGAEISAALGEE